MSRPIRSALAVLTGVIIVLSGFSPPTAAQTVALAPIPLEFRYIHAEDHTYRADCTGPDQPICTRNVSERYDVTAEFPLAFNAMTGTYQGSGPATWTGPPQFDDLSTCTGCTSPVVSCTFDETIHIAAIEGLNGTNVKTDVTIEAPQGATPTVKQLMFTNATDIAERVQETVTTTITGPPGDASCPVGGPSESTLNPPPFQGYLSNWGAAHFQIFHDVVGTGNRPPIQLTSCWHASSLPGVLAECVLTTTWLGGPFTDTFQIVQEESLKAVAGVYPAIQRGSSVNLDGSKSTGNIAKWRWTYQVGQGCPAGSRLAPGASGTTNPPQTTITILCSISATLTVEDNDGNVASDTTQLSMQPRPWLTGHSLTTVEDKYLRVFSAPDPFGRAFVAGVNRCPDGSNNEAFCRGANWSSDFTIDRITAPDEPFRGWVYVADASRILLDRVAFINPWITPSGPAAAKGQPNFYNKNSAEGIPVGKYVEYTIFHEGMGFGVPVSGHMQAYIEAMRQQNNHNDPQRYLETLLGTSFGELQRTANRCLNRLDEAIFLYGLDDLEPFVPNLVPVTRFFEWSGHTWRIEPIEADPPKLNRNLITPECADT